MIARIRGRPGRTGLSDAWDSKELVGRAARRQISEQPAAHPASPGLSHLAMRGAAPRAIQELAGHQDIGTTQRYMHLSPAAIKSAIQLLAQPAPTSASGDIVETLIIQSVK